MKEINLNLTEDEVNLILESLGTQPFVKVYQLMDKIQNQAGQQLKGNLEDPDKSKQ